MLALVIGGLLFWSIDGLMNLLGEALSTKIWIGLKSLLLPTLSVTCFQLLIRKLKAEKEDFLVIASFMVVGIWLLSPFYLCVLGIFSETGMNLKSLGWLLIVFPMTAVMVSTYSGGLLGLILVTIVLPLASILMKNKKVLTNGST